MAVNVSLKPPVTVTLTSIQPANLIYYTERAAGTDQSIMCRAASHDMPLTQIDPWSFTFANVITSSKPSVQSEPFYRPLYKNLTSSYSNSFVGGLRIDVRGAINC